MSDPKEFLLEDHGLQASMKHADGSLTFEGKFTPELARKMARLFDILSVADVMDEPPVRISLRIPPDTLPGFVEALDRSPNARRRPQHILHEGYVFVPEKPTEFWVGLDTWHPTEAQLRVRQNADFPESVTVSCRDDPQIIFSAPERWIRRNRFSRMRDGV